VLGLPPVGGHTPDTSAALAVEDGTVVPPRCAKRVVRRAEGHGRATKHRDFLQLGVRPEPDPLTVGGEERASGTCDTRAIGSANGCRLELVKAAQIESVVRGICDALPV